MIRGRGWVVRSRHGGCLSVRVVLRPHTDYSIGIEPQADR